MSTDRELLELAAKAAGISIKPVVVSNFLDLGDEEFVGYRADPNQCQRGWFNPLADDGDALRLAVKLALDVEFQVCDDCDSVSAWRPGIEEEFVDSNGDRLAAARRAIVISAAQIGREMP